MPSLIIRKFHIWVLFIVVLVACSSSVERAPTQLPADSASPTEIAPTTGQFPGETLTPPTQPPSPSTSTDCNLSSPDPAFPDGDLLTHTSPDGAFALGLSGDWSAVDLSAGDLEEQIASFSLDFPELVDTLRGFIDQSQDSGLWIVAFFKDRSLIHANILPNYNLRHIEDPVSAVLPIELVVDQTLLNILSADPQLEVLGTLVAPNANGLPVGLICSRRDFSGEGIFTYQRQVIVMAESGMLIFNFAAADAVRELIIPHFDQVIHSLNLLEPASDGE